jgi:hypothetical protein
VMVWDLLFGTYFRDSQRRPPADIGIPEFMSPRFVHQIMWPFLTQEGKQRIEAGCVRCPQAYNAPRSHPKAAWLSIDQESQSGD